MELTVKEKVKAFYEKHKTAVLLATGAIIGGGIIFILTQGTEVVERETIPDWAEKWREKCLDENLLFENGLPMFANENMTAIYSDAFASDEAREQFREEGFEIVERT